MVAVMAALFWPSGGPNGGAGGLAGGSTGPAGRGREVATDNGWGRVGGCTGPGNMGPRGCRGRWVVMGSGAMPSGSRGRCGGAGGRGLLTSTTVRFSGLADGCSIL